MALGNNSAMVISGRTGFATGINGVYERYAGMHDNYPVFRMPAANTKLRDLFLYYHGQNRAWAIAEEVGSSRIVGYNPDGTSLPCLARAAWKITDPRGQFLDDHRVMCSEF